MFKLLNVKYKHILSIEELDIPRGVTTCIVGESGSGKSTLLRLLNDIISPDEGEIYYNNQPIKQIDPITLRRKIIMLPQQPVIFDGNVKDNLVIGSRFSELPAPQDGELNNILELVRLNKSLTDSPEKFSGGEKQRLALARVLLIKPEVLLLDEPSSALDENTEWVVMDNVVKHAGNNGISLIIVTHSKKVAELYGENNIQIRNGKI